jgi:peptidoglycan/xylan/chitin deacetylase (PgdA/CDA1 family)
LPTPSGSPWGGEGRPGTFVLTLDFELIWGTLDLFGPERFRRACEIERDVVLGRLLDLLDEFRIPATWCVLGHLFLDRCRETAGVAHPEIVRPRHPWVKGDWFAHDPRSDESRAPLFYGRSLVAQLLERKVTHEVGCHSFSHVIFGDAGCSEATAASELMASVKAAGELGVSPTAFVFPRDAVGHLRLLPEHGFTCYRGASPTWYERKHVPPALRRAAHLLDVLSMRTPPVVVPEKAPNGLSNLPGSMIYFPAHGLRRLLPTAARVRRALRGLRSAVRHGKTFHLWFHPTNLSDETEAMLGGLRTIVAAVDRLRSSGQLVVATMTTASR